MKFNYTEHFRMSYFKGASNDIFFVSVNLMIHLHWSYS